MKLQTDACAGANYRRHVSSVVHMCQPVFGTIKQHLVAMHEISVITRLDAVKDRVRPVVSALEDLLQWLRRQPLKTAVGRPSGGSS